MTELIFKGGECMENKKTLTKKQILMTALAGALAYSLFGFGGLIVVGIWFVWKMI